MSKRKRGSSYNMSNRPRRRVDPTIKYDRSLAQWQVRGRSSYSSNKRTGGFIGMENKFVDYSYSSTVSNAWTADNPTTTDCISAVAQGDGESSRDGRAYSINSVHIHGTVLHPVDTDKATPIDGDAMRIVVVHDSQTNGAEVTATEVMDAGASVDWLAFRNLQFTSRFKVLFDETIVINPVGTAGQDADNFNTGINVRHFSFNKKFKTPLKVNCNATTAVVGAIVDNSIAVLAITKAGILILQYESRVRFSG